MKIDLNNRLMYSTVIHFTYYRAIIFVFNNSSYYCPSSGSVDRGKMSHGWNRYCEASQCNPGRRRDLGGRRVAGGRATSRLWLGFGCAPDEAAGACGDPAPGGHAGCPP